MDEENNLWPIRAIPSKFQLFKSQRSSSRGLSGESNAMQEANKKK